MKLSASDRRREMRPAVAALVVSALRLGLHVTEDERKGRKGQAAIELTKARKEQA